MFADSASLLHPSEEKARYEKHNDDVLDLGYRKYLSPLLEHLSRLLPAAANGLDFGCGHTPVITTMLREKGFSVAQYDPIFAADKEVLQISYDFVAASEVVEHFRNPRSSFELISNLLQPAGLFGISTRLRNPGQRVSGWWYAWDPTHVSLYSEATMRWIADHFRWEIVVLGERVVLFKKEQSHFFDQSSL
jgi:SAM-dependent methyltransferase